MFKIVVNTMFLMPDNTKTFLVLKKETIDDIEKIRERFSNQLFVIVEDNEELFTTEVSSLKFKIISDLILDFNEMVKFLTNKKNVVAIETKLFRSIVKGFNQFPAGGGPTEPTKPKKTNNENKIGNYIISTNMPTYDYTSSSSYYIIRDNARIRYR